ncbi:MAG: histidine--tRNA ligase [Phycisphaerae bacterium]|nr:histidine--tRNA ligase [Phycisphaerae bacterium]
MDFQPVKGTRDFYPDAVRVRNWLFDTWRRVAARNGFEEYDSPIVEYLDLYTAKSGEGIVSELFHLTDRGGRDLAIRPETTPALARMVNARINSLPRPIKWFCIQRLCRAEKPQRGRSREFFMWNVDVIGADSTLADAECVFTAVDFLREVGLGPDDVQVRIGSRPLVIARLRAAGVAAARIDAALLALDKRPKVTQDEFEKLARGAGLTAEQTREICGFLDADPRAALDEMRCDEAMRPHVERVDELLAALEAMGAGDYCTPDWHIVRGLAYYTGIVYEAFDAAGSVPRAVAGGGRYDNLLEALGGPKVGATGFGMGDVVLGILLDQKGKIPPEATARALEYFVIDGDASRRTAVLETVGRLRRAGLSADFSYAGRPLGKQLKDADRRGARRALILFADGTAAVKDLATGEQHDTTVEALLDA